MKKQVRTFIHVWIFLMAALSLFSQKREIDSLQQVLTALDQDTSRINTLNILAYQLYRSDPSEGAKYAYESIELARKLGFRKGLARAYNSLGACYWNLTELDSAILYYEKSFEINEELGLARGTTGALSNIAIIYENKGDYINAINTYTKAFEIMKKEGFVDYAAITTNNLGIAFLNIGSYPEALDSFHEAFRLADSLGMMNLVGPALINIGRVYKNIDEPTLELEIVMKALRIGEEANDPFVIALASNNLGTIYRSRDLPDSALIYFKKALSMNEEIGRKSSIILNLSNIGATYREQDLLDESRMILEQALSIAEETGQSLRISRVNYQLGLTIKKQQGCREALPYFLNGFEVAKEGKRLGEIENISKELYQCYNTMGLPDSAYRYLLEYTATGDSLINEENIKELAKIESRYQFENQIREKNNEIKLLESREQVANLQITLLIIGVILIVIIAFFLSRMMILKRERRKRELEAIGRFRESMTSMIAHDLKTPLSVIMNSSNGNDDSKHMARQMLHLINNMLDVHRFESTDVKLDPEQCMVREIIAEAKSHVGMLLKEKDLTLKVDIAEDCLVLVDKSLIVRVLVNLLTNAIKYSPLNEVITLSVEEKSAVITISVSDRGKGIAEDQVETIFRSFQQLDPKDSGGIGSTGLGLTFVKKALQAHGTDIHLKSEKGKGAIFSFDLPVLEPSEIAAAESGTHEFEISQKVREMLSQKLETLRKLDLYQVGDIENELDELKGQGDEADLWIQQVLNSVYAGNKEKYDRLLDKLEA